MHSTQALPRLMWNINETELVCDISLHSIPLQDGKLLMKTDTGESSTIPVRSASRIPATQI